MKAAAPITDPSTGVNTKDDAAARDGGVAICCLDGSLVGCNVGCKDGKREGWLLGLLGPFIGCREGSEDGW